MGIYDAWYLDACEVDIALYALHNYRITADMDRYQGLMLDYKVLQARQQALELDLHKWCNKVGPLQ
jgi:hypothetical protein